ncbi:General vesicular transport factor [Sarcoptes scabiei]|uniref:General vesicular transport factor n=1 Tax=Sarcoptes scabiei TaxID=52283 RepID=A0A834R4C4_SARSC|nr:General vesicular transport factor [Sarcoptes scabiei]
MEYLKSGWKSVLGSSQQSVMDERPNVAETVEKLVERVETSTLLEDRRDACRALKSLSKTYRLEVGAQAMDCLVFVLQNDANDNEIIAFALETLNNIIGTEDDINSGTDLNTQFTEIFIKRKENVQLVVDLLSEFDFKIRWPTIKLLYCLLRNKLRDCQDCILTHPMGISKMMDLLIDPREVIRNDALLLLIYLTKNNTNIQKIVAFENAFDRILDIISSEGCSEGGIIVEDCLTILINLLKTNTSNQNFFKEGSYINRLLPFLDFSFETDWNPQKINNLLLMFKVFRCLVSPKNPAQVISACQKVMNQNEVLQKLCTILMSNGIPAEILTETINCVAEVIRGNQTNQDYFSRVNAPIDSPKPVIVILLMSMINEKQPFELRCAVLYCFQCFLYKNDLGQAQIIETLLPTSSEDSNVSAGQLLCSGFFSQESLSNWFVAVALSYALLSNTTQKEQLLRVQLAIDSSSPPTTLMSYCSNLLQQGGNFQRRISLLMLLATWLADSSSAVSSFVSITTNVPYLTSQVSLIESDDVEYIVQGLCAFLLGICICYNDNSVPSFTRNDLCQIINNRIGKDIFIDKLSSIAKNEKYSQAIQKPQLSYLKGSEVLFDYEFCNLFRIQEKRNSNDRMNQQQPIIEQLRDQIALLKAQKSSYNVLNDTTNSNLKDQQKQSDDDNEIDSRNQYIMKKNSLSNSNSTFSNQMNYSSSYNNPSNVSLNSAETNLESITNNIGQIDLSKNVPPYQNSTYSQIEFLMNENRRLLSIIDQYKSWEQNFYAYFQQQNQQPGTLSTMVNVSDSDLTTTTTSRTDQDFKPIVDLNQIENETKLSSTNDFNSSQKEYDYEQEVDSFEQNQSQQQSQDQFCSDSVSIDPKPSHIDSVPIFNSNQGQEEILNQTSFNDQPDKIVRNFVTITNNHVSIDNLNIPTTEGKNITKLSSINPSETTLQKYERNETTKLISPIMMSPPLNDNSGNDIMNNFFHNSSSPYPNNYLEPFSHTSISHQLSNQSESFQCNNHGNFNH